MLSQTWLRAGVLVLPVASLQSDKCQQLCPWVGGSKRKGTAIFYWAPLIQTVQYFFRSARSQLKYKPLPDDTVYLCSVGSHRAFFWVSEQPALWSVLGTQKLQMFKSNLIKILNMNYSQCKRSRTDYHPRAHWISVNGTRSPLSVPDRLAADRWSHFCINILDLEKHGSIVISDFQTSIILERGPEPTGQVLLNCA